MQVAQQVFVAWAVLAGSACAHVGGEPSAPIATTKVDPLGKASTHRSSPMFVLADGTRVDDAAVLATSTITPRVAANLTKDPAQNLASDLAARDAARTASLLFTGGAAAATGVGVLASFQVSQLAENERVPGYVAAIVIGSTAVASLALATAGAAFAADADDENDKAFEDIAASSAKIVEVAPPAGALFVDARARVVGFGLVDPTGRLGTPLAAVAFEPSMSVGDLAFRGRWAAVTLGWPLSEDPFVSARWSPTIASGANGIAPSVELGYFAPLSFFDAGLHSLGALALDARVIGKTSVMPASAFAGVQFAARIFPDNPFALVGNPSPQLEPFPALAFPGDLDDLSHFVSRPAINPTVRGLAGAELQIFRDDLLVVHVAATVDDELPGLDGAQSIYTHFGPYFAGELSFRFRPLPHTELCAGVVSETYYGTVIALSVTLSLAE